MRKHKVNVGANLPDRAKDLLVGIDLCIGPGVAFRGFQSTRGRVDGGKKLAQRRQLPSFIDFEQQLRLALQVVVTKATVGGGPGKLQSFIIGSEFNRKIGFHPNALVEARVETKVAGRQAV